MRPSTALLDANVLYSVCLRDCLLRLANEDLYLPLWSAEIHGEWIRSILQDRPDLDRKQLDRTREQMDSTFPDAIVEGYEHLIPQLQLPDPNDRHVLAAAIHGEATVIVTENLKDFPDHYLAPHKLIVQTPDTFIADNLIKTRLDSVLTAVRSHRKALINPPRSSDQHLKALKERGLVKTVFLLQPHQGSI